MCIGRNAQRRGPPSRSTGAQGASHGGIKSERSSNPVSKCSYCISRSRFHAGQEHRSRPPLPSVDPRLDTSGLVCYWHGSQAQWAQTTIGRGGLGVPAYFLGEHAHKKFFFELFKNFCKIVDNLKTRRIAYFHLFTSLLAFAHIISTVLAHIHYFHIDIPNSHVPQCY